MYRALFTGAIILALAACGEPSETPSERSGDAVAEDDEGLDFSRAKEPTSVAGANFVSCTEEPSGDQFIVKCQMINEGEPVKISGYVVLDSETEDQVFYPDEKLSDEHTLVFVVSEPRLKQIKEISVSADHAEVTVAYETAKKNSELPTSSMIPAPPPFESPAASPSVSPSGSPEGQGGGEGSGSDDGQGGGTGNGSGSDEDEVEDPDVEETPNASGAPAPGFFR